MKKDPEEPEGSDGDGTEVITNYHVTSAGETDRNKDAGVIDRLAESGKQPQVLYEDAGYPSGQGILDAARKGTELVAPMPRGALPEDMIGRERFRFDETSGLCTGCPAGHAPLRHAQRTTAKNLPPTLHAYFDGGKCHACEHLHKCVVRKPNNGKKGNYHLEIGAHLIARDQALANQCSGEWWDGYAIRSGIEATMSETKRGHGMGKLRVRRMPRVRLAVTLKITGCNVKRWLRASVKIAEAGVDGAGSGTPTAILVPWMLLVALLTRSRRSSAWSAIWAGA